MLLQTKAIVLRTVEFGDTSLIVTCFTQAAGLQSYLVKGARTTGKKGQSMRPYLQPAALLDLVVYQQPQKNLQYIREMRWAAVYKKVLQQVLHTGVAIFMIELLQKSISQHEADPDFFAWVESYLLLLDEAEPAVVANLPLHFALRLSEQLGLKPEANFGAAHPYFDLKEGCFVAQMPAHPNFLEGNAARLMHDLLACEHPITLYRIKMNRDQRQELLNACETYFQLHLDGFGHLNSQLVLQAIFSG